MLVNSGSAHSGESDQFEGGGNTSPQNRKTAKPQNRKTN